MTRAWWGNAWPRHKAKRRAKRYRRRVAVAEQRRRQLAERGPRWTTQ